MIDINRIVNSVISSCTYVLSASSSMNFWLLDVGDIEPIVMLMGERKCLKGVFLTHVHYDHIYGLNELLLLYPEVIVYTNEDGRDALFCPKKNFSRYHPEMGDFVFQHPDNVRVLNDGDAIELFEGVKLNVTFTPGHDVSCITYELEKKLFTGDSYIPGCKLVCSFPRSQRKLAKENEQKLKDLEAQGYEIMPGHWIENNEN